MNLDDEAGNGRLSEHNSAEMARIMDLPILITLADGTVIDATQSGANSSENRDGTTDVHKTFIFERIIDYDDIERIVIGGSDVAIR